MDFNYLTAPCGIDCFSCEYFHKNIDDKLKKELMESIGCDNVGCMGCRSEEGCRYYKDACKVLDCVNSKGYYFCCECKHFPCDNYNHKAEECGFGSAEMMMHNLCFIKNHGIEKWIIHSKSEKKKLLDGRFFLERGELCKRKK